jgi:outer membrane lipoprotein-sorting protein
MKALANRFPAVVFVVALATGIAFAGEEPEQTDEELTVDEIVDNAVRVSYYQGADGSARVKMTITDPQGRVRNRELSIIRRDDLPKDQEDKDDEFLGDQKFYVYFKRPADVRKMAFMVYKHVNADDDRWLYLSSLDLVKRIASTEERTSFAGSHFYYEDVSGRNKEEDVHELLQTTESYYVVKNTPRDPDLVEFAYYKTWIHRKTFIAVKAEYYDNKGEKYREYKAMKVEHVQGYPTVTRARMTDDRIGGYTDVEYSNVKYNVDLPDEIFTERYLRKAPIKYLR